MSLDLQNILGSRATGFGAAIALSAFASQLFPTLEDTAPVFTVTAITSGAVGYWVSRAAEFNALKLIWRLVVAGCVILLVVVLSLGYIVFYNLATPELWQDVLGYLAFGCVFATACFVLGLVQILVFEPTSDQPSNNGPTGK